MSQNRESGSKSRGKSSGWRKASLLSVRWPRTGRCLSARSAACSPKAGFPLHGSVEQFASRRKLPGLEHPTQQAMKNI
jgi:hypothetical protein